MHGPLFRSHRQGRSYTGFIGREWSVVLPPYNRRNQEENRFDQKDQSCESNGGPGICGVPDVRWNDLLNIRWNRYEPWPPKNQTELWRAVQVRLVRILRFVGS